MFVVDPSVLHLIQLKIGGFQITSIIFGALGGCTETLNFFKIMKSNMEEEAVLLVRFPAIEVLDKMQEMELLQFEVLLLNLDWFLAIQIALSRLVTADVITVLHWGFQPLLQIDQISSLTWNCRDKLRVLANHLHR